MNHNDICNTAKQIKENIEKVIIGNETTIEFMLAAFFAGGHILMEDLPGTGKTMLAKSLAASINGDFKRIQFTPDLLPADVTGISVYKPARQEFVFQPGPAFTNILLADELNRATPRTQSALLECMEEKQITTDGVTRALDAPFFIIATQNPIELAGTYPLPEAQLDRFCMRLTMNNLNSTDYMAIIDRFICSNPMVTLEPVCSKDDICIIQDSIRNITVHESIRDYAIRLMEATHNHPGLAYGVNARGLLQMIRVSQALATIRGRDYVLPDDIKALFIPCLSHKVAVTHFDRSNSAAKILNEILEQTAAPTETWN